MSSQEEQQSSAAAAASSHEEQEIVWFREEERWELTWPIWHMLPHEERKALASKHGYHTIGEFEEYMSLRRAVGETTEQQPYENSLLYAGQEAEDTRVTPQELAKKKSAIEEEEDESDGEAKDDFVSETGTEELDEEELMERAGKILLLPEELIHKMLEWLPVDVYATLALVSPHWKYLTRTESVYKRLCERCYLNQSKRRVLNASRFGHSYRSMLENRPRVRAGGGLYVMKYATIKKPQRDMWTEVSLLLLLGPYNIVLFGQTHPRPFCRYPTELFWRLCITDISIFKRMAQSCTP